MAASFLQEPVERFLDLVAARQPAPGGGAVAAVTVAAAAGLVAMAARFAGTRIAGADGLAAHADELRTRAMALATEDAEAYAEVLAASAAPRDDPRAHAARLARALRAAAGVPLRVTDLAAQVAELGVRLVEEGNPQLAPDASAAIWLAEASARAAAGLVRANAAWGNLGPDLPGRAGAFVRAAQLARERAAGDPPS